MKGDKVLCDFGECPNHVCYPMTDKEIVQKSIEKAVENGWDAETIGWFWDGKEEVDTPGNPSLYELVFDHSFAKAFFGEENGSPCVSSHRSGEHKNCNGWHEDKDRPKLEGYYPKWAYCLQVMVLEEDKLKYLAKYL